LVKQKGITAKNKKGHQKRLRARMVSNIVQSVIQKLRHFRCRKISFRFVLNYAISLCMNKPLLNYPNNDLLSSSYLLMRRLETPVFFEKLSNPGALEIELCL